MDKRYRVEFAVVVSDAETLGTYWSATAYDEDGNHAGSGAGETLEQAASGVVDALHAIERDVTPHPILTPA